MKTLIQYGLICLVSVLIFDATTYLTGIKEQYFPTIKGRMTYPDGYFKADPVLGHDIAPNHPPVEFNWHDHKAPIFSNQYGCFDKNETYENPVIYLTGDSLAWGYAEYEKKYGYLIEQELGVSVAKCGVTHSGQKYQLVRLKRWIKQTGLKPDLILLGWVTNDPENDLLFPQATVLRGKFVDQAIMEIIDARPQRATMPEIDARLRKYEEKQTQSNDQIQQYSFTSRAIAFLKQYSTSANIARKSLDKLIGKSLRGSMKKEQSKDDEKEIRQANREAIHEFIAYANQLNIPIIFLTFSVNQDRTAGIYEFLKSQNQYVVDYPTYLKEHNIPAKEVQWPIDGHPNNRGNKIIADMYIDAIKSNNLLPKQ